MMSDKPENCTAAPVAEGVALPPLPKADKWWREEFGLGDSTVHEGHSDEQMQQYAFSAVAPYAERIRQLERELTEHKAARIAYASEFALNVDGEPDVGSIHANIRSLKRELATFKGEHATQLATKSIDTPEFKNMLYDWCRCEDGLVEYRKVVAYIDGRTAGPAVPEGWKPAPVEPTEEMIQAACLNQASLDTYPNYEAWWNSHSTGISEKIRGYVSSDYKVMIAAAPKPQEDA